MANNKKRGGATSPLTVLIRILVVIIFVVALVITFMRIAEVNQNDRKAKELAGEQATIDQLFTQL
ncbi:MAG: hypothetical protein E7639_02770 [Ruminococcaceae bacterium]|nr:hypothetical protein [Oscillospiraceae bacterium]